jgi:hypothetical protein
LLSEVLRLLDSRDAIRTSPPGGVPEPRPEGFTRLPAALEATGATAPLDERLGFLNPREPRMLTRRRPRRARGTLDRESARIGPP